MTSNPLGGFGAGYGTSQRNQYLEDSVLSAPPARLLTMLYDRLLLDLGRAETAQQAANWQVASENLLHGQSIIAELISSLKTDSWDGADGLLGLYNYAFTALVNANIQRNPDRPPGTAAPGLARGGGSDPCRAACPARGSVVLCRRRFLGGLLRSGKREPGLWLNKCIGTTTLAPRSPRTPPPPHGSWCWTSWKWP